MNKDEELVLRYLRQTYPGYALRRRPAWLKGCHWKPSFLLKTKKHGTILAADVLLSGVVPKFQYTSIVAKLLNENPSLCCMIVTSEEGFENNPQTEEFCTEHGIGLKTIVPGIGLQTIVRTDLDPAVIETELVLEDGWFPSCILKRAQNLHKLAFADIIDRFTEEAINVGNDENRTRDLVLTTIDTLLSHHPSFGGSMLRFMRLEHFEQLLRLTLPNATEHVIHSFRVFLAGCPIINQFYDCFYNAHRRFCIGPEERMRVEYAWLLTAIFHDIGKPKEKAVPLLVHELQDDDLEVTITSKATRWARDEYISARRALGSFAAFVAEGDKSANWEGGLISDQQGLNMSTDWMSLYDQMQSHAIISAFDFLADIFAKARASDERRHRPFILTHAVPAALSILLHDWRLKGQAKTWGLFPIDASVLPMAALLTYIDTWDDYKREGLQSYGNIRDYRLSKRGASVHIEWGDSQQLDRQRVKYAAYKKALANRPFLLTIKAGMAGES